MGFGQERRRERDAAGGRSRGARGSERWDQFIDYLCLGLSQDLGRDVKPVRPRKQTSEARLDAAVKALAETGALQGTIRAPDAVGPITVNADLRTRKLSTSVAVEAPREGRPLTRVKWILRQTNRASGELRVDVSFAGARETSSLLAPRVVVVAKAGWRPGRVSFSVRSAEPLDLRAWLRQIYEPPPRTGDYGRGDARATGGSLIPEAFEAFTVAALTARSP